MSFGLHAPRSKACEVCAKPFLVLRMSQKVCGMVCARKFAKQVKAKGAKELRERKAALKTRSDWIKEAQAVVNKYCRLRDIHAGRNCISCGAPYRHAAGGAFDAGHFRSVGSAPHMRFYLPQIRLQCVRCNRHLGGNVVEYRRRLVIQLGEARVQEIEAMQGVAKWSVEYLKRLKAVMAKKARRLEKQIEMQG